MSTRPVFHGDSRDMPSIEAYERELRAWEQEQEQKRIIEDVALVKAAEQRLAEERVTLVKNHGATILIGNGIPDSSHGVDGQGWLDWTTLDLWLKVNGQWEVTISLLPEVGGGPSGPAGADGAPGATTWLALTDTPGSYVGQAGEAVRVNAGATGLEFFTPGGGGVTDHGALTGLVPDDDHTQYLLLAGRSGGQTAIGGTAVAEQLNLRGSTDAGLGRVFIDSPLELGDVIAGDQTAFRYRPTFSVSTAYIGGMISAAMDVTFSNSVFIYALLSEGGIFRQAVAPGFAAFTLFNALPRIVNSGNFNLVQALVLNAGPSHERNSAGTSTTVGTVGLSFAPQVRARAAGAVMTYTTGMTAVSVAPTYSTVAGATANFGTIRGMHCKNPALGLFQTGGGIEAMTAYVGVEVDAIPFGGTVPKVALRSALVNATNTWLIQNTGGAWSDFGDGFIRFNDDAGIFFGTGSDVFIRWNSVQLAIEYNTFFGIQNSTVFFRPNGDNSWDFFSINPLGLQYNVEQISFGTANAAPGAQNWFVNFTGINGRQPSAAGSYSDVLWTAGGSIDLNGLAMTDVQAFKIDSPSVLFNGGSIADFSNLFLDSMPSVGTRSQALRVLGRSRLDGLMCHNEATLTTLTADVAAQALPPNNLGRYVLLLDADALGPWTIQGIVNVQVGDAVYIVNNGANAFDFGHEDVAAAAADRIITPTAVTWTIGPREFVKLWYDPVVTRWRILESNGA